MLGVKCIAPKMIKTAVVVSFVLPQSTAPRKTLVRTQNKYGVL